MQNISDKYPVVFQTGFRIFFLAAAVYTVFSMFFWFVFYVAGGNIFVSMPLTVWHGYEMIFGFTMAVVAGFLLTAVTNWTGLPTATGGMLSILFLFWFIARVLAFMPTSVPIWPKITCDLVFMILLISIILRPIIIVKQWGQSAVISKLILVFLCGGVLFISLHYANIDVEHKVLRFAIYMIISLILTIARRVMPFFIERGVGYPVTLRNSRVLDLTSVVLLIGFSIVDIFFYHPILVAILASLLCIVHVIRLTGWYTHGIWSKPLLWILYLGYLFIISGFLLKVFVLFGHRFDDASLHAFTAGGIGLFIIGMMSRVALGHTGRNIGSPPHQLVWIFSLIILSAVCRVFLPLINEKYYITYIGSSQVLWTLAYIIFIYVYYPILTSPRPDGKLG